jgi:hypothetical protein
VEIAETDELDEVLRPLASLISKSQKAQQKLAPGTWQHTMLRQNLEALDVACELIREQNACSFTRAELLETLRALTSMITKAEKAQAPFSSGTAHHTLQRNRLKALRRGEVLVKVALTAGQSDPATAG